MTKTQQLTSGVTITGKLKVELIQPLDEIPTSWTVPRSPMAYLVDVSSLNLATLRGETQSVDAFIQSKVHVCHFTF